MLSQLRHVRPSTETRQLTSRKHVHAIYLEFSFSEAKILISVEKNRFFKYFHSKKYIVGTC